MLLCSSFHGKLWDDRDGSAVLEAIDREVATVKRKDGTYALAVTVSTVLPES